MCLIKSQSSVIACYYKNNIQTCLPRHTRGKVIRQHIGENNHLKLSPNLYWQALQLISRKNG